MKLNESNLPSRLIPYRVKEFDMAIFKPAQLTLLSKAVQLNSITPVIEALSQTLDGIDVNDLTIGDFFYLLTVQRLTCFKRRPLTAEWICSGAIFHTIGSHETYTPLQVNELVTQWEEADEEARKTMTDPNTVSLEGAVCSHNNYEDLNVNDFRTIFLKDVTMMDDIDYPRVRHLQEFIELQSDPELGSIIEACQYIAGPGTLREKIDLLLAGEDMDLFDRLNEVSVAAIHGVSREITKACAACGSRHAINYTVDAQSFFL